MKILLVEDSPTLRHAMSQYIIEAGHTPLIAESGEEALQKIEDTPVEMIIMDVEMPGLNGFETTALIREWLGDHWIPIIFVTGKSEDEDYREGIEAGGDDYLIKPVSKMIIKAKIRAMERISSMRDQLNHLNSKLETLSQLDDLTQILNRRTFNEQALQQQKLATRKHTSTCVLMIDVDHFKLYNDYYGHPAGDKCLQEVTRAISNCLHRTYDLLGRYGGEEFIVLLPDTDIKGGTEVAMHINDAIVALNISHSTSPTAKMVTVSIGGVCCLQTKDVNLEKLINAADKALYRAKNSGRNQYDLQTLDTHQTILIAHNSPAILQQASLCLQEHFNIVTADCTEEGLKIAKRVRPDLLILSTSDEHSEINTKEVRFPLTYSGIPIVHLTCEPLLIPNDADNIRHNHVVQISALKDALLKAVHLGLA